MASKATNVESRTTVLLTRMCYQLHDLAVAVTRACVEGDKWKEVRKQSTLIWNTLHRIQEHGILLEEWQEVHEMVKHDHWLLA